jgi:Lysyl oxidase
MGCDDAPIAPTIPETPEAVTDPGALIELTVESKVGVLLDEVPEAVRDRIAQGIMDKPDSFWLTRAQDQPRLTNFRFNFRTLYYPDTGKNQLPVPPEPALRFTFDEKGPQRVKLDGHDMVVRNYRLHSYLVTTVDSVSESEPALATVDGTWDEPITFPVDPTLLMERTGYACLSEADFPPNSVETENAYLFYDDTCAQESPSAPFCHLTLPQPSESCVEALKRATGHVDTVFHYRRVAWDEAIAAEYRVGAVTQLDAPDMAVRPDYLENNHIVYRYFEPDDCAIEEKCVGGPGWRRLLMFDALDENVGGVALNIGPVDYYAEGGDVENALHGMYEYSACHEHYHFKHYGDFKLEGASADVSYKQGFCLLNTDRLSNHEFSPITSPYVTCDNQGTQAGWSDRYAAGIPCQWLDITESGVKGKEVDATLTFHSNPDGFLCEGQPVLDEKGEQVWEKTDFETADGKPVDRPKCEPFKGAEDNDIGQATVAISEKGGVMTSPCRRNQIGPNRNCDFTEKDDTPTCMPGADVTLLCSIADPSKPQVVRVCDYSFGLESSVSCSALEARATKVIAGDSMIKFKCPEKLDNTEIGGRYSIFTAPLWNADGQSQIVCSPEM